MRGWGAGVKGQGDIVMGGGGVGCRVFYRSAAHCCLHVVIPVPCLVPERPSSPVPRGRDLNSGDKRDRERETER